MQKVLIIGGTGFIGFHAAKEFLLRGYSVSYLNIPDLDLQGWFPEEIAVVNGDVFKMSDDELMKAMYGFDVMIYSVGPDDRSVPMAPSYNYFREKLVDTVIRVFNAARSSGIKRSVLLNSYFSHFHKNLPHLRLVKRHNYIRARVEQYEMVIETGEGDMDVIVLGLPYIFGVMPGRPPLWKEALLDRLLKFNPVFYPSGGSAMITVEHLAEAVAGAVEHGEHGKFYPVSDVNMTWKEMFTIMFKAAGIKRRIVILPLWIAKLVGFGMQLSERIKGKEPGLNLRYVFQDIISRQFYLDADVSIQTLKHGTGGIVESIEKTAIACFPHGFRGRKPIVDH